MTVANTKPNNRQTKTKIDLLKPTTLSLLLKNEKGDEKSFRTIQSLHTKENQPSKRHKITTQKQTKIVISTHKPHRTQSVT